MRALVETVNRRSERIFIVGVDRKSSNAAELEDSLGELAELAHTAGGKVIGRGSQKLDAPYAGTFIGSGKAVEPGAIDASLRSGFASAIEQYLRNEHFLRRD